MADKKFPEAFDNYTGDGVENVQLIGFNPTTQKGVSVTGAKIVQKANNAIAALALLVEELEQQGVTEEELEEALSTLREEISNSYLSKIAEDTAAERITFDKGIEVSDLATKNFVQGKFAGAGLAIYDDETGNSVLEVDKLNVRKEAWFNEIVINQIRFQGGIVVYSAANMEVLSVVDGGSYIQANFDTKDGQIMNQFAVDDQIRCQRFSGGNVIKYYMSRVTSIGTDFIRLSKTDIDGTLNVEVGDAIVQFGNRTNTGRQSLIEVNVLDGGKQTFYQNVNSYSLTNKNYLELGRVLVDGEWKNMIRSFGGAYVGNRDLSSYIKYNEATGKVEIKASVQFLSSTGYKDVGTGISDAQTAAATEAARLAGIAKTEAIAAAAENASADVATLNATIATMQSQIDGEVSNWFYPGLPTGANNPETLDTWDTNAKKLAHVGDTYTCIDTYEQSPTTAGKSWRYSTSFTWVAIADSDAVLALQKAALAQSTADGKSTTYLVQPTKYSSGDVWILASDWNGFKAGEQLTATTTSASFVTAHWEKKVRYTDDTAVENLQIGGTNLILNSNIKLETNQYKIGEIDLVRDLQSGEEVTITVWGNFADGQKIYVGLSPSTVNLSFLSKKSNGVYSGTTIFDRYGNYPNDVGNKLVLYNYTEGGNLTGYISKIKLELGNKATDWTPAPEDTDAAIAAAQTKANDAASAATTANNAIGVMSNDDIISAAIEKSALKKEWDVIAAEKASNDNQATSFGVNKAAYGTAYTNLSNLIGTNLNVLTTDWNLGSGGGVNLRSKFSAYYTARNTLLNAISTAAKKAGTDAQTNLDNLVIGGANLFVNNSEKYSITSTSASTIENLNLLTIGVKYCVSFEARRVSGSYTLHSEFWGSVGAANFTLTSEWVRYTYFPTRGTYPDFYFWLVDSAGLTEVRNIMIQEGNKPTAYQQSLGYLGTAIKGSTDVDGGLVTTNLLMVKNDDESIAGGISGITDDNVLLWSGLYENAITDKDTDFENANKRLVGVLDKKDGGGHRAYGALRWNSIGDFMVGAFKIISGAIIGYADNKIKVKFHTGSISQLSALQVSTFVRDSVTYSITDVRYNYSSLSVTKSDYSTSVFEANTVVKFNPAVLEISITNGSVNTTIHTFVLRKDGVLVGNYSADSHEVNIASAGTYTIEYNVYSILSIDEYKTATIHINTITPASIDRQENAERTEIGKDGLFSYWSKYLYFYFNKSQGLSIRGAIDIPAGLGGGNVASVGTILNKWGLAYGSSRSTNTVTIKHNVTDAKFTVNVIPRSSFTWYISSITPATSSAANDGNIVVVCSSSTSTFDFVILRTPY